MNVGIVGLGEMGSGFVDRLLLAKVPVTGWNRTKQKAERLIAAGMKWTDSPRAVAAESDVILTMLSNDAAVDAVLDGEGGLLGALSGKVFVEMSTIAPAHAKALAARVEAAGARFLDAPVLGSQVTLAQGKLLIMVGGDVAALERARPALEAIALKVIHVGEVGQGKAMKLALNLQLATQILALSEGLLLAEKSGIPRAIAMQFFLGGAGASPMIQYRGPLIDNPPEKAWFDCTMMQKDVTLALQLGRDLGVPLPTTSVSDTWLTAARAQGLGDRDFSILYEVLARASGQPKQP